MELDKILTVSTGHVTPLELDWMKNADDTPHCITMQESGRTLKYWTAFFYVGTDEGFGQGRDDAASLRRSWPSLALIHDFAAVHGCRYFRLDPDGGTIDNLPNYND